MADQAALNEGGFASLAAGDLIGTSDWVVVEQRLLDLFGAATLDDDPMHLDPEWARDTGPFGTTVAFGFWTMSLLTHLLHSAMNTAPARTPSAEGYYLNYGIDRLRLIEPVPINSRIRATFVVNNVRADPRNRILVTFGVTIEIEGNERPALVADWLGIWVRP
jgi:acyl dehydratase